MPWIYLILAGLFEVGFTTCLKLANNFENKLYTALFAMAAITSFYLLNLALRNIPIGTAYAVWTGIGAAGTAIVGIIYFNEPTDFLRLVFLSLLIISVVGLKFVSLGS